MGKKLRSKKAWSGRFQAGPNKIFEKFSRSIDSDIRFFAEDIQQNKAWAEALQKIKIYSMVELKKVKKALDEVGKEIAKKGPSLFTETDEDIHMAIERLLTEKLPEPGARLHTGRSRNDQVATDTRLYLKKHSQKIYKQLHNLLHTILTRAGESQDVFLPGFTHLRPAQPITWSYYLLSWFWPLSRSLQRLKELYIRMDELPLGSGALAGSGFPVDREFLRKKLGFKRISENGLDAVSSRDILQETSFIMALIVNDLSRLSEDLILYSSPAFNFLHLDDSVCTGSSIMPQKKNPDALELIRGYAAKLQGLLVSLLTLTKGLPSAYNRDLQWDKPELFDALETLPDLLSLTADVLNGIKLKKDNMQKAISPDSYATELADHLALNGVPFRQAHHIVGKIVLYCEQNKIPLTQLPQKKIKEFHSTFANLKPNWHKVDVTCNRRDLYGGTGRKAVRVQIKNAQKFLRKNSGTGNSPTIL
ncbi:argininosuccinate lyase [Candidatus Riflebacteria bacterium]